MHSEKQYIDLYRECREQICAHSAAPLNAVRDAAFEQFERQGFPSRKVERYKYTSVDELFAPDYGVNVNRLEIPVDPYKAFRCDVPNLSTSLYLSLTTSSALPCSPRRTCPRAWWSTRSLPMLRRTRSLWLTIMRSSHMPMRMA